MTAMIREIFFVGREGYMKSKIVIKFGTMFFSFVRALGMTLQGKFHIYSI